MNRKLCKWYGFEWYEDEPEKVMDNDRATILWDMENDTRTLKLLILDISRPDIIVKNKMCP